MANHAVLEALADPDYQTELGQFNIEINVAPRPVERRRDDCTSSSGCAASLNAADEKARRTRDSRLVMVGMLPTLRAEHFTHQWLTTSSRYNLLDQQIFAARGEDIAHQPDRGHHARARTPPSTWTSRPSRSCRRRRARRCSCTCRWSRTPSPRTGTPRRSSPGVQAAIAGNAPFLAGAALWHESRVPVFEQATDTRPLELKNQGVRPRVWFGERWITNIFDLFEENSTLLPRPAAGVLGDEDPAARSLDDGGTPELSELRMHNGTIYRWNRPIYDTVGDTPHLRIENRVLPAGPTVIDIMANAAFYYGTLRALVDADRPDLDADELLRRRGEPAHAGHSDGFDAQLYWPEIGWVRPDELVLRRLLPMAHEGLRRPTGCPTMAPASATSG